MRNNPENLSSSEKYSSTPPPTPINRGIFSKLISPKNLRKLISNKEGDPLAIETNPEDKNKNAKPFGNKEYVNKLKKLRGKKDKEYAESYAIWLFIKKFLETTTGKTIEELKDLDIKSEDFDEIANKLEDAIAQSLKPLDKYGSLELCKKELRKFSELANAFYNYYISKYISEEKERLDWDNSLTSSENNIGKLALKYINSRDLEIKRDSKLKLFLMLILIISNDNEEKGVGFSESTSFLTNFITRSVVHYEESEEVGSATKKWLETQHRKSDGKTFQYKIHNNESVYQPVDGKHLQPIILRKAIVEDEIEQKDGNKKLEEWMIEFFMKTRYKDPYSIAEKFLREPKEEEIDSEAKEKEPVKDHHGIKFVVEKKEDAKALHKLLITKLREQYFNSLTHSHSNAQLEEKKWDERCDEYSKQLLEIEERINRGEKRPEDEAEIEIISQKLKRAKKKREESIQDQQKIKNMLKDEDKCITIEGRIRDEEDEKEKMKKKKRKRKKSKRRKENSEEVKTKKVRSDDKKYDVDYIVENLFDTLEGGEHQSGSDGSSPDFQVRKCYIDYHHPDFKKEKTMPWEWQFMLYKGFGDTKFREDVGEEMFHINRVFRGKVMELLASPSITGIDLDALHKKRIKEAERDTKNTLTITKQQRKALKKKNKQSRPGKSTKITQQKPTNAEYAIKSGMIAKGNFPKKEVTEKKKDKKNN